MSHLETARAYLQTIEKMGECTELEQFLAPNIVQIEYPNKITPQTATRDLATMLAGCEQGKAILAAQSYDIQATYEVGDMVILEVAWSGTLKISVGDLDIGDKMTASFAVFLRFKDGKIVEQRNYDCFD